MATSEFEITPPELQTFLTDGEAASAQMVRSAARGPAEMASFLLGQAVGRLERDGDDPMLLEIALVVGDLSVTVAAYNTSRRLDTDAPTSFVGASAGIGQFVREGGTVKISYQKPCKGAQPPSYWGITFRERQTADAGPLWYPEKVWTLGEDGQPILVDHIEDERLELPHYDGRVQDVLAAPLPKAGKALFDGVIAMKKPTASGQPKYVTDITSGYLTRP